MFSNNLVKYEYLTGEDLGLKLSTVEQAKFEYSPLGMSLSKSLKKNKVKSVAKSRSDFHYGSNYAFYRFYKRYGEFKQISLDSKYNRAKEFNKFFINFKCLKTKNAKAQLKKEQIMKNVDELYKNYNNVYKSDYNTDNGFKEDKKKKIDYKQFQLGDEINKESKLDEKTKQFEITDNRYQGTKSTKKEKTEKVLMKYTCHYGLK